MGKSQAGTPMSLIADSSSPPPIPSQPWLSRVGLKIAQGLGLTPHEGRLLWRALLWVGILRVLFFIASYYAMRVLGNNTEPMGHMLYNAYTHWDARNYFYIAEHGYVTYAPEHKFIAFFPLFPWLVRALAYAFNNYYLVAGQIISFVSTLLAAWFLQLLVHLDDNDRRARRALLYLLFFPTAYFLAAPYTESLFLATALGAFWCARTGRWWQAGAFGLFCALSRIQGVVLFPALLIEIWLLWRVNKRWDWRWLWTLGIPAGVLIYLGINYSLFRNPFAFTAMQREYWTNYAVVPWEPVWNSLKYMLFDPVITAQGTYVEVARFWGVVAALVLLWMCFKTKLRLSYQAFVWLQFIMVMMSSFLMSLPRYLLCFFPFFIALAKLSDEEDFHQGMLAGSALIMGGFAYLYYVGKWAF
jgi:hypothetical protein